MGKMFGCVTRKKEKKRYLHSKDIEWRRKEERLHDSAELP